MPCVLRVNLSICANRNGSVGGTERELLEDLLLEGAPLVDCEKVAILAIAVDDAVCVDGRSVDTPLERVGMIGDAGDGPIRFAAAAQRVGVLKPPLDLQLGAELGHKKSFRTP